MRVAIVHYHFRPGGVTRVVENAIRALNLLNVQIVAIGGEPLPGNQTLEAPVQTVNGVDYAESGAHLSGAELADQIIAAARSALNGDPDVWHFHNHALGKNCALTHAARLLADRGYRILLQIHDFAEDGRPHLFEGLRRYLPARDLDALGAIMYPIAPHVHYATINRRDADVLRAAGVPSGQIHYLPNAVYLEQRTAPIESRHDAMGNRLILYPIRAIRRKNLGEALLWCALVREEFRLAITLAPKSPTDRIAYDRWVSFANREKLPCDFEVGERSPIPFPERLASAQWILTTSIAEGFGLAFLEPWLVHRPVAGRDLPVITRDFTQLGIRLPGLYDALRVPARWVDRASLEIKIHKAYETLVTRYGLPADPMKTKRAVEIHFENDMLDFGHLDEEQQELVIGRVLRSEGAAEEVEPHHLPEEARNKSVIESNAALIEKMWGLKAYGERLRKIYDAVAASPACAVNNHADIRRILETFLAPEMFWLLRT